tara:strand:+ start:498 stop:629 length:132 start_codon:yes stop_codon:yes gene_type:complete
MSNNRKLNQAIKIYCKSQINFLLKIAKFKKNILKRRDKELYLL